MFTNKMNVDDLDDPWWELKGIEKPMYYYHVRYKIKKYNNVVYHTGSGSLTKPRKYHNYSDAQLRMHKLLSEGICAWIEKVEK